MEVIKTSKASGNSKVMSAKLAFHNDAFETNYIDFGTRLSSGEEIETETHTYLAVGGEFKPEELSGKKDLLKTSKIAEELEKEKETSAEYLRLNGLAVKSMEEALEEKTRLEAEIKEATEKNAKLFTDLNDAKDEIERLKGEVDKAEELGSLRNEAHAQRERGDEFKAMFLGKDG